MNKKLKITDEIKKLSFEEALSELEQIVEDLERGDIELEDSISCLLYTSDAADE